MGKCEIFKNLWALPRTPLGAYSPPPPPTPLIPQMKVDFVECEFPIGNARPSAVPGAVSRQMISFQLALSMREVKSSPSSFAVTTLEEEGTLTRCQLICWPLLATFLGGLGPNRRRSVLVLRQRAEFAVANASTTSRRCKYFLVGSAGRR